MQGPGEARDAGARRRAALAAAAVALVAALLVLVRLDQRLLWVDEAETALLGRSILVHGVPTAFDGINLISQEIGREYGPDYVWHWTPWLEKYLAAASFAALGESTLSARLPFALLGVLAVLSMYPLARALFGDRLVAVLAMAFLALSVPFLLHVRQCRYYAPAILSSIWVLYCFARLPDGRWRAVLGLVLASHALFQSNVLTFCATGIALAPCTLTMGFDRRALCRAALAAALTLLTVAPWVVYYDLLGKTAERLYPFAENFRTYLDLTNRYTFPALALLVLLAPPVRRRLREARARRALVSLLVLLAVYVVALSAAPWSFYRWTINLLPVAAVVLAWLSAAALRAHRPAGVALTALLLLTAVPHRLSAWPITYAHYNLHLQGRSFWAYDVFFPLGNLLHEVAHSWVGPMEELLTLLHARARPGDRIFISYGDLVLQFYTRHEVRGGQSGRELHGWPAPEWVILRTFFRFRDRPHHRADVDRTLEWLGNHVDPAHYTRVPTTIPDVPWDAIAEPQLRWYRPPSSGDPMEVYRRST